MDRRKLPLVQFAGLSPVAFALLLGVYALFLSPLSVAADADKGTAAAKADAPKALPKPVIAPVPLGDIGDQAEAASAELAQIARAVATHPALARIAAALPAFTREVDTRLAENVRVLARNPSLDVLRGMRRGWVGQRRTLEDWSAELEQSASKLDRYAERLDELQAIWQATLAQAQADEASPDLLQRVQAMIAAIARTHTAVHKQREDVDVLSSRLAAQDFRIADAADSIRRAETAALTHLLERDGPPIWAAEILQQSSDRMTVEGQQATQAQLAAAGVYVSEHWGRFAFHALLVVLLAVPLWLAQKRLEQRVKEDAAVRAAEPVLGAPLATALLVAFAAAIWIYPDAPRVVFSAIAVIALVPTFAVVRRTSPAHLHAVWIAIVALTLLEQARSFAAAMPLVPRVLLIAEMLVGAAFSVWYVRQCAGRRRLRLSALLALLVFLAIGTASALGYVTFSNLAGPALVRSGYIGLVLYALVQIIDAFVVMAMHLPPLNRFGSVRNHSELLRRRTRFVIALGAFALWLTFVLQRLTMSESVFRAADRVLGAEARIGSVQITTGNVLAFILAVWASFAVSRFVQFVLEEEVFPHARLGRGLPYAISRTVHYLIVLFGFFIAMAVLGVDMTKFTILASAFTVGVGFGLQNIFNNFVSGLILLFERPVKVGDVIEMASVTGVVERIGIRASVLRTTTASEVIMPNGKLIQDPLTNWTFTQGQRGIDLQVAVNVASDPRKVIATIERVAAEHPHVLKQPPPRVLTTRLGPDWMGFNLNAYTDKVLDWVEVVSDLAAAIPPALTSEGVVMR